MQNHTEIKPATTSMVSSPTDRTLVLRMNDILLTAASNYEQAIMQVVAECPIDDRKLKRSYRKRLLRPEAYDILFIIWKETGPVTDDDLMSLKFDRQFNNVELTAHSMATEMADDPKDVASMNSRIRLIGLAAEAVGLMRRIKITPNKVILKARPALDQFFIALHRKNAVMLGEQYSLISELDCFDAGDR